MLLSEQRDTAAARRFFIRPCAHGPAPVEVTTDKAGPYLRVLAELVPAAAHVTEQYGNNRIEADHGSAEGPAAADARTETVPRRQPGSPPAMPSCRTSAAATMNSPSMSYHRSGCWQHSASWRWLCDNALLEHPRLPRHRPTQQRRPRWRSVGHPRAPGSDWRTAPEAGAALASRPRRRCAVPAVPGPVMSGLSAGRPHAVTPPYRPKVSRRRPATKLEDHYFRIWKSSDWFSTAYAAALRLDASPGRGTAPRARIQLGRAVAAGGGADQQQYAHARRSVLSSTRYWTGRAPSGRLGVEEAQQRGRSRARREVSTPRPMIALGDPVDPVERLSAISLVRPNIVTVPTQWDHGSPGLLSVSSRRGRRHLSRPSRTRPPASMTAARGRQPPGP